jgi:sugar O-acyltransferase (sialic acid O-acetyltransferase NeuD family)
VSDNKIILAGYSGHGFVVAEAAQQANMPLFYYSEHTELNTNPFGLHYLGFEGKDSFEGWNEDLDFILGIGDNAIRVKVAQLIKSKNKKICNVIHPTASIGQKVTIGEGNFIARNVSVNPLASISNYCILNTGCIVEHECVINQGVHIAPGAVLAGNVTVGENTFVGANAVIKQGVTIGKNVVIGAGSVVLKDVLDHKIVVGNPAKEIK